MAGRSGSAGTESSVAKSVHGSTNPVPSRSPTPTPPIGEKPIKANWVDYDGIKTTAGCGLLHSILEQSQPPGISRIILVDSHNEEDKEKGKPKEIHNHHAGCDTCKQHLRDKWSWPEYLFSEACSKSNGYVRESSIGASGSGLKARFFRCLVKQIKDGRPEDVLELDISYMWYEMTITIIPRKDETVSVICYGVPNMFHDKFEKTLNNIEDELESPSIAARIETALLHEIVKCYDHAIWAVSKATRKVEKSRGKKPNFGDLHELLRHAIHLTEVLDVAVDSLGILHGTHSHSNHSMTNVDQFWYRLLKNFIKRSQANQTRLGNEIQLALNLVTQADSAATIELSKSAHSDSRAVLAITIITMVFLPATFIATLFGMSFFNYDQATGWSVTGEIWIFFVVSAVLTIATLSVYAYWLHRMEPFHKRREESKKRREQRKLEA